LDPGGRNPPIWHLLIVWFAFIINISIGMVTDVS